jgi:hypothetical protein
MRYILGLLVILTTLLCGCNMVHRAGTTFKTKNNKVIFEGGMSESVYNIEHDGCEYIVIGMVETRMMAHKGNCKNPIHLYNRNAEDVSKE